MALASCFADYFFKDVFFVFFLQNDRPFISDVTSYFQALLQNQPNPKSYAPSDAGEADSQPEPSGLSIFVMDGFFSLLLLVAMDNHSIILYRFGIARHDHLWPDRLCVFSLQPAVPESLSLGLIRGLRQVNGRVP